MKAIVLFLFSIIIFISSTFFHNYFIASEGSYFSELHENTQENGVWRVLTNIIIENGSFTSEIYIEGDGIDGVAVFRNFGNFTTFRNGEYKVTSELIPIQETKIKNVEKAKPYTDLLYRVKKKQNPGFNIIYYNNEIVILDLGEKLEYKQLYIKMNSKDES